MNRIRFKSLAGHAASLSLLAALAPAHGQCSLYRANVPDFDQKRSGVPGDGGMYCVPTSAVNWMAYIANNGFGPMMSGPRNWQASSNYNYVTAQEITMGILMGTSATDGTTGNNGTDGLRAFMMLRAPYLFNVSHWYGSISPFDMWMQMQSNGLVNICYGYYKQYPSATPGQYWYGRDGGHCVTLNGITNACASGSIVRLRNPADGDSSLFQQGTFANTTSHIEGQSFPSSPLPGVNNFLFRLTDFGVDSTTRRYVDSMYSIHSAFACWGAPSASAITINQVISLLGDASPAQRVFALPQGTLNGVISVHPRLTHAAYVALVPGAAGVQNRVMLLNLADGTHSLITPAGTGKIPIVFGRDGRIFVADGSVLKAFDLSGPTPTLLGSRTLSSRPTSLAYDDVLDELVALQPSNRRLVRCPRTLDSAIDEPLPTGVPAMGDGSVLPDPATGRYIIAVAGSPTVHEISLIPGSPRLQYLSGLLLPAVQSVQGLCPADGGGVFAMCDGSVRVLDRDPGTNRLRVSPTQVFTGLTGLGAMCMSTSRTNFERGVHDTLAYRNVIEPENAPVVPDCPGDFNGDGVVSVQDIFDFLAAWFSQSPTADFDGSGVVGVQDIFDFLAAWFSRC